MEKLGDHINPLNNISSIFSKTKPKKEKQKHYRQGKLTDSELEKFDKIALAIDAHSNSDVVRWCLIKAYNTYQEDIDMIAEEKKKIRKL